jgi:NAD-dependent DNA ligase
MAKSDASDNGQNQRINWLAEQIAYHSDLYYNQAITEISDSEFDALWDELKQLDSTHSQLQRVGAEIDPGTVKVDHMFPMRSLNKGTSDEDIGHFVRQSLLRRHVSFPNPNSMVLRSLLNIGKGDLYAQRPGGAEIAARM